MSYRTVLPNGLTLLVAPQPHVHRVALNAGVRGGPRYESATTNGLSHYVEHMLFHGSQRHDARTLNAMLDRLPVDLNAVTHRDAVNAHLVTSPGAARDALTLLGEMVVQPRMDPKDFEVERGVVIEELYGDMTDAGDVSDADQLVRGAMWPDHPMGMPVAGVPDDIEAATLEDARAHHARLFTATNMVLCVAGPVQPDQVWRWIQDSPWAAATPGTGPLYVPAPVAQATAVQSCRTDDAQLTVLLSWVVPPSHRPWAHACNELLAYVLDSGFSSRLRTALIDEGGHVYKLHVDIEDYGDVAMLNVEFDVSPDRLQGACDCVATVLQQLAARGPTDDELFRAQAFWAFRESSELDTPDELAGSLVGHALLGTPYAYGEFGKVMASVGAYDVARAAAALGTPVAAVVGPVESRHLRIVAGCHR